MLFKKATKNGGWTFRNFNDQTISTIGMSKIFDEGWIEVKHDEAKRASNEQQQIVARQNANAQTRESFIEKQEPQKRGRKPKIEYEGFERRVESEMSIQSDDTLNDFIGHIVSQSRLDD